MYMQFFIPMQPPTTTHNAKQLHAYMKGGQPHAVLHDSPELKAARAKLHAYLAPHAPKAPIPAGQPVRSSGAFPPRASAAAASGAPANPTPTTWKRPSRTR
jgi:hypothetical protein